MAAKVKIRMLTSIAGVDWTASYGDVIEVTPDEAERFVASEQAEIVDQPKREKTTRQARETAASPPAEER